MSGQLSTKTVIEVSRLLEDMGAEWLASNSRAEVRRFLARKGYMSGDKLVKYIEEMMGVERKPTSSNGSTFKSRIDELERRVEELAQTVEQLEEVIELFRVPK